MIGRDGAAPQLHGCGCSARPRPRICRFRRGLTVWFTDATLGCVTPGNDDNARRRLSGSPRTATSVGISVCPAATPSPLFPCFSGRLYDLGTSRQSGVNLALAVGRLLRLRGVRLPDHLEDSASTTSQRESQRSFEGSVSLSSVAAGAERQCAPAALIGRRRAAPQLHC
jgi:hypothetical protein